MSATPLKIFLSARYERRLELRSIRDDLHRRGDLLITSSWLEENHGKTLDDYPNREKWRFGETCLRDITHSHICVFFLDDVRTNAQPTRGGMYVEFGFALNLYLRRHKPALVTVGSTRRSTFHYHPDVTHCDSVGAFLKQVNDGLFYSLPYLWRSKVNG